MLLNDTLCLWNIEDALDLSVRMTFKAIGQ